MWAKIDDGYFGNRKVLRLSGPARFLHLTSLIWAAGQSDGTGILPKPVLPQLGILAGIPAKALRASAEMLVAEGLWEDHGDDWLIHDFVPYTPPKEREANAARLADWRAKKRGRNADETPPETPLHVSQNGRPVPVPSRTQAFSNEKALALCALLADLMEANGCKRPRHDAERWVAEMDRLLRIDGRDPLEVERIIRWSQQDSFWKTNIHSPLKLRAQFDKLRLKAEATPNPTGRMGRAIAAARQWQEIADIAAAQEIPA